MNPSVLIASSIGPNKTYAAPLLRSVLPRLLSSEANHSTAALVTFDGIQPKDVEASAAISIQCISSADAPACIHGRLARMRESQRQFFLSRPSFTHLYWHDADMVPPETFDIIGKLLALDAPIASGIYNLRGVPGVILPMAGHRPMVEDEAEEIPPPRKRGPGRPKKDVAEQTAARLSSELHAEAGRLVRPYAVGMGCMLVRRDALERLPFRCPDSYTEGGYGEDVQWCLDAVDRLGIRPLVDLSLACWHVDENGVGTRPTMTLTQEQT